MSDFNGIIFPSSSMKAHDLTMFYIQKENSNYTPEYLAEHYLDIYNRIRQILREKIMLKFICADSFLLTVSYFI